MSNLETRLRVLKTFLENHGEWSTAIDDVLAEIERLQAGPLAACCVRQQREIDRLRGGLKSLAKHANWGHNTRWTVSFWRPGDHPAAFARQVLEGKP
jgi:hypothetical protein